MTVPKIDPALFTWTSSGVEYCFDVHYKGVFVTQVLLVGVPGKASAHEATLREQLAEHLHALLLAMTNHESLYFWAQVIAARS